MKHERVVRSRFQGIDALRGIAASLVLAHHIISYLPYQWAASFISVIDLGKLGVAIFFLISGFVIPFSLKRGLFAFWIGRAARLLPALWLSMLFCVVLGAKVYGLGYILANAFMVTHLFGVERMSDPYWTLCWELYFYVIVALVFAVGWLRSPAAFGWLSLAFGFVAGLYDARFSYLIFMFCGTLLRMVLVEKDDTAKPWLRVALVSLIGACLMWWLRGRHEPEFYLALAIALPAFLLLWNRFTHPALLWLGAVSYSLYLFHLPIVEALAGLPPLPFVALSIALPLLVAAAVYRWVEAPAIKLGRLLSDTTRSIPHRNLATALPRQARPPSICD